MFRCWHRACTNNGCPARDRQITDRQIKIIGDYDYVTYKKKRAELAP